MTECDAPYIFDAESIEARVYAIDLELRELQKASGTVDRGERAKALLQAIEEAADKLEGVLRK